jgi:ribose transport system substrate-binding protein
MQKKLGIIGATVAALFALAACSSSSSSSEAAAAPAPKTIAIISPDYSAQPAAKTAIDEFVKAADAAGFKTTVTDTKSDNAKVNGEITTAVSQKVDAIVLAFGTPKEFGEGLAAAKAANVPVFGLDTGGTEDPILVNVTTDNGFLGSASAQAMMDAIGKPGNIAMIVFDAFQPVQIRGAEAKKLFEAAGYKIVEYVQGDPADSTGFAKKTVKDFLTKYPKGKLDGVWSGWDATALGAYQATQEAGRTEVKITGVDGQDFARAEVAKGGNWVATMAQDWPTIATTEVKIIQDFFAGTKPMDKVVYVPGMVINKDNAK